MVDPVQKEETLSLYDIPKVMFSRCFEEVELEQSELIQLVHRGEDEQDSVEIHLDLYKRLLHYPNDKDTSVFDRERYYHPEDIPEEDQEMEPIEALNSIKKIIVMLCHGGYFSGAVFSGKNVVVHKTFHHYVTRKKQGGRQSSRDKSGNRPKSGGASIRRHNEKKHENEIRDLFVSWKDHFQDADLIFTHFPGRNRADFYMDGDVSGDSKLVRTSKGHYYFHKDDTRIRPLPFTTQRPNYTRVREVFVKLTSISVVTCITPQASMTEEMDELLDMNLSLRSSTDFVFLLSDDEEDDEDEFCAPDEEDEESEE